MTPEAPHRENPSDRSSTADADLPVIPHSRPSLGAREADAAAAILRCGQIAQGPAVARFEQALADRIGLSYGACTASGTAALHLVLAAMDIGPGDEVLIPAYVCTALLNAVGFVGAQPVIADVDPESGNLDPDDVRRRLTPRTRAIILAHLFGRPAPVREIAAFGVPVIEDCAQAIGATTGGREVGGVGAAAIFSFYATKVLTTGEGGMVVTDSKPLMDAVCDLREYDGRTPYRCRFNYKLTDLQAAVGLVQLSRLDGFVARRRKLASRYTAGLAGRQLRAPAPANGHIYYRYVTRVPDDLDRWLAALAAAGITAARPVQIPLDRALGMSDCPGAAEAWNTHLSLPIYPELTGAEQDRVLSALSRIDSDMP